MLISILLTFVFSAIFGLSGKFLKKNPLYSAVLPLGLFVYFLGFLPKLQQGEFLKENHIWVPSFGVNFSFLADGLGIIFALMITFIGGLVFIYTAGYLKNHPYLNRFYAYLSIFMGAMLGVVLSDNLITLFLFWELTSITSFFLIGFNNEEEASRKSALTALIITGLGGLLLFVGVIILGQVAGSYTISEMISQKVEIAQSPYYLVIIWLVFGAIFTKSAQFPFHFWLPGAMKAPTPVSTYLHSATMVKAGVFLALRLTPILGDNPNWNTPLIVIGSITMVYSAFHTIFKTDLKAILAYTTISALGILIFLIGLGTEKSLLAAVVFLLIHATYKATLFLVTGIIDHETGTRNILQLSGLKQVMFPVAVIAFVAAISHGGFPPSFGFVGKDLIYEATLNTENVSVLTIISLITNVLLIYAGLQAGVKPFIGNLPSEYKKVHLPEKSMLIPPFILSALCLIFGLFPSILEKSLIKPAMNLLGNDYNFHLKLWHGFNEVLLYSFITIILGLLAYFFIKPSAEKESLMLKFEVFSPKSISEKIALYFVKFSDFFSKALQNGYLTIYVRHTILVASIIMGFVLYHHFSYDMIDFQSLSQITFHEMVIVFVLLVSIILVVFTSSRLVAVSALGLLSFSMCMIFMMYSAPDLAMTQFSIDTLTTVLFVLILYKLPNYLKIYNHRVKIGDGLLALGFGSIISMTCLMVLTTPQNTQVSSFYAENSYLAAHGKNVVNVILVDFRGADTMMEISVLSIAAIGVYGLIKLRLKTKERFKA